MLVQYMPSSCPLLHTDIVSKRIDWISRKQRQTIANYIREIWTGSTGVKGEPLQMQAGLPAPATV